MTGALFWFDGLGGCVLCWCCVCVCVCGGGGGEKGIREGRKNGLFIFHQHVCVKKHTTRPH